MKLGYLLGILFIARRGLRTRIVLIADRFIFSTFKQYSKALKQTDGSTVRLGSIANPLASNRAQRMTPRNNAQQYTTMNGDIGRRH
jgi:hypothetical protein